ncbi:phosphoesterase, partial [Bifidobacterium longum]
MRYFTTDTHFGHPLVTVLRGFTTFDPTRSRYEEVFRAQG